MKSVKVKGFKVICINLRTVTYFFIWLYFALYFGMELQFVISIFFFTFMNVPKIYFFYKV